MKKAICVGINNYQGTANNLNGCINDANDWASLLESFGFETSKIIDEQATKANILNMLQTLISEAKGGDVVVFTYSGHGTQVMDSDGDEGDSYDEALYVVDGPIVDDELRLILNTADNDAQIIVITDSCFSGTVTKALKSGHAKPRYHRTDSIPAKAVLKKRFLSKTTDEEMVEILLTGCSDSEYSYDAEINGKWNGAMTANTIPLIKAEMTYNELYTKLRTKLPSSEYPQTPQLEGSEENKNMEIFTEKADSANVDNTGGSTAGESIGGSTSSTGCFSTFLTLIAFAIVIVIMLLKAL